MEIETLSKLSAILASCIGWVTLELYGFSTDPRLTPGGRVTLKCRGQSALSHVSWSVI